MGYNEFVERSENMKKWMILCVLSVAFLMIGCSGKLKTYTEIDYQKLMDMYEQKQSFILFIGSTDCTHCDSYKETLNKVIKKYQVSIIYLDISKLSDEEHSKVKSITNFTGTPTTLFIENGEETSMYDRIDGNRSMDKVVEKLKKKGYIK